MTSRIRPFVLCLGVLALGCGGSETAEDPRGADQAVASAAGCKRFVLSLVDTVQGNLRSKERQQAAAYVEEVLPSMDGYVQGVAGSEHEEKVKQLQEKVKHLQQTLAGSDDPKSEIDELKGLAESLPDLPSV